MDDLQTPADPMGELADDFVARLRRGERPSITDYCVRHRELAPRIRELFPRLVVIEQFGLGDLGRAGPSGPSLAARPAPARIGEYAIVREIGRGGMGVVYEAVQETLGRRVALKVLPQQAVVNDRLIARFQSEARAVARLHHTNIVPVFGVGQAEGDRYIVMQLIDGCSLDAVVESLVQRRRAEQASPPRSAATSPLTGPAAGAERSADECGSADRTNAAAGGRQPSGLAATMPAAAGARFREAARIGLQIAEALEHAHQRGVLHRDIKPSNVLVDGSGTVWITDFGLAKTECDANTQTGDVAGTIRYMAPERFNRQSDPRSDVYGIGATLYELLTLQPAFAAGDYLKLMQQVMHASPKRPRQLDASIPRDLETIVVKAMERDPRSRYESAGQMADDLRRYLADLPIRSRQATLRERMQRWCLRNPAVASLTLATGLALLGGMSATAWKWREAEQAWSAEHASRQAADAATQEVSDGVARLKQSNAFLRFGNINANLRRWNDAEVAYARAIDLRPDHARVLEDRAHGLYAQLGLWDLAYADLRRAMEIQQPLDAGGWHILSLLQASRGDRANYLGQYAEMCDKFGRITNYANPPSFLRAAALLPVPGGLRDDTLSLASAVHQSDPRDPYYAYVFALANCRAGRYPEAVRLGNESLNATGFWPSKPLNYPVLAIAYSRLGDEAAARRALSEAEAALDNWINQRLRRNLTSWVLDMSAPDDWPVHCWDFLECEVLTDDARQLLNVPPKVEPRIHILRGRALAALRRWSQAVDEYERANTLMPDDGQLQLETHRSRAYYLAINRDLAAAGDEFSQARRLAPHDSDLWRFEAFARVASGKHAEYQRVCQAMLAQFRGTNDRAIAYDVVDACIRGPDAVDDMPALVELAKLGAKWYIGGVRMLGAAQYRAGQYRDAIESYAAASQFVPLRADDLLFLALAHHALGEPSLAERQLDAAEQWISAASTRDPGDFTEGSPAWGDWYEPIFVPQLLSAAKATIQSPLSSAAK